MEIIETLQAAETPAAIALGCFDGLHLGHQRVISCALGEAGLTPAVFTFDENPLRALRGEAPPMLMTNRRKAVLLARMGIARLYRIPFAAIKDMEAETFAERVLIEQCRAEKLCCGYNFRFGRGGAGDGDLLARVCARHGVSLAVVPPVSDSVGPVSSSRIRRALFDGNAEGAAAMLGRPFGYDFEVVHGRHLGTQMGTPTINQKFPEGFILPKFGVYASVSRVDGRALYSVTNIGKKPTVGSDYALSETWIPEYAGDLYGRRVEVELLHFIRPERKFADLDALREEIRKNRMEAEKIARKRGY